MNELPTLIFGVNGVSLEVATQMRGRGRAVTLVTSDEALQDSARQQGFICQLADYTDDDTLRALGIGQGVEVIFSLLDEDAANVFLTISARALDPAMKIVALSHSQDGGEKLTAAGASKVIDPYEISGRKIYELIRRPLVAEILEHTLFGQQNLDVAQVEVGEESILAGKHLSEMDLSAEYNLVLLGVVDREIGRHFLFATVGLDHKLDAGDILVLIGPEEEIGRFRREAAG